MIRKGIAAANFVYALATRFRCVKVYWFDEIDAGDWKLLTREKDYVEIALKQDDVKPGQLLAFPDFPKTKDRCSNMFQVHNIRFLGSPIDCRIAQCRMLGIFEAMTVLRNAIDASWKVSPEGCTSFYVPRDSLVHKQC
jgi:hypothetical protein